MTCLQHAGLPHSEITGSIPVCSSPVLIAAYHVLHRLQKPRHPPSALVTFSLFFFDLNHKNFLCLFKHLFSFTRCLEIAVHNITIDSLSFTRYRLFNFILTLPRYLFSNLSMNFSSSSFSRSRRQTSLVFLELRKNISKNFALSGALTVYVKKT